MPERKPLPFDKDHPFRNLGIRVLSEKGYRAAPGSLTVQDVELRLREFSGINGVQQLIKNPSL